MKEAALLVVDDNEDNRYTLTRRLAREGYANLTTAADGGEALERLAGSPVDLVLLDIMMPGVNGYEVLERMKADAALRDVGVIMISALDEMDSVVRCIELGAEDYLTKPFNPTLLRARVGASLEKKRLRDAVRRSLDRVQRELAAARHLQLAMLPREFPPWSPQRPISAHAVMEPAREVGGDLYDCFDAGEALTCFLVGDVSGKGAAAGMFMARTRSLVRMAVGLWRDWRGEQPSPAELLATVNRELCIDNADRMFVTLLLGVVDARTGTMRIANAGHPGPHVVSPAGGLRQLRQRPGMPLGIRGGARYEDIAVDLVPGDTVFACTDGVLEALDEAGELFSAARLETILRSCAGAGPAAMVTSVKQAVDKFAGAALQADDITALAIAWQPSGVPGAGEPVEVASLTLANDLAELARIRDLLDGMAARHGLDAHDLYALQVAMDELSSNVVRNAWRDTGRHNFSVTVSVRPDGVWIEIEDDGIPFDPTAAAPPLPVAQRKGPGGVGIDIVRKLVDRFDHVRIAGRNRTTLFKARAINIRERQP